MTVQMLIDQLSKMDREARVYMNDWHIGSECLYCLEIRGDEGAVVVMECEDDVDMSEEIWSMFEWFLDNGYDESAAYDDMIDIGITPDMVRKYYGEDEGNHMEQYCVEHGLI